MVRTGISTAKFPKLGRGEHEAIVLALEVKANLVLIDETLGRRVATDNGLSVKGILGVLEEAADKGWIDLPVVLAKLQHTSIYLANDAVERTLQRHRPLL